MPQRNVEAVETEIIVIDKPFLSRPRLYAFENDNDPTAGRQLPLYRQVELLREALRPFAELGELFRSPIVGTAVFSMNFGSGSRRELTIEDFRRARSILSETDI
jgi:hypothetical protein